MEYLVLSRWGMRNAWLMSDNIRVVSIWYAFAFSKIKSIHGILLIFNRYCYPTRYLATGKKSMNNEQQHSAKRFWGQKHAFQGCRMVQLVLHCTHQLTEPWKASKIFSSRSCCNRMLVHMIPWRIRHKLLPAEQVQEEAVQPVFGRLQLCSCSWITVHGESAIRLKHGWGSSLRHVLY
jgi:hypothetical protein